MKCKSPATYFLQNFADAVAQNGASLKTCFGFVDGTLVCIGRSKLHQRQVHNEYMA